MTIAQKEWKDEWNSWSEGEKTAWFDDYMLTRNSPKRKKIISAKGPKAKGAMFSNSCHTLRKLVSDTTVDARE